MHNLFTLIARIVGDVRTVTVTSDGMTYIVTTATATQQVRTLRQAIQLAREEIGNFLVSAERTKAPWGLYLSVANVCTFYGDTPPRVPRAGGAPLPPDELINRIREEYKKGGPIAALQNAIRIIEAYLGRRGHRAAA
jgi:hypothetical protein